MKKSVWMLLALLVFFLTGCGNSKTGTAQGEETSITLTEEITELEKGFSAVRYDGDYGFDRFLSEGGASSDQEVVSFLTEDLLSGTDVDFRGNVFGCSTVAAQTSDGNHCSGGILTGTIVKLWLSQPILKTDTLPSPRSIWILSARGQAAGLPVWRSKWMRSGFLQHCMRLWTE